MYSWKKGGLYGGTGCKAQASGSSVGRSKTGKAVWDSPTWEESRAACLSSLGAETPWEKKKNLKVLLKVEGKSTKYMASLPLWGTLASCWRHFVVSALILFFSP